MLDRLIIELIRGWYHETNELLYNEKKNVKKIKNKKPMQAKNIKKIRKALTVESCISMLMLNALFNSVNLKICHKLIKSLLLSMPLLLLMMHYFYLWWLATVLYVLFIFIFIFIFYLFQVSLSWHIDSLQPFIEFVWANYLCVFVFLAFWIGRLLDDNRPFFIFRFIQTKLNDTKHKNKKLNTWAH